MNTSTLAEGNISSRTSSQRTTAADFMAGAVVGSINDARIAAELASHTAQDSLFQTAMGEVSKIRDFLSTPQNILGSERTKHGEIAEQVQVGISNARDILEGKAPSHTFEGVGRTAPEDYKVNGDEVQSKFINGARNTLDHISTHARENVEFIEKGGYYHAPNDQFSDMSAVNNGIKPDGMSDRTYNALKNKIAEIEQATGRPFDEVVKPGISDYKDIQTGKVDETLDGHEKDLRQRNNEKHEDIAQQHQPGWVDGAKAAAGAAAVAGAFSFANSSYQKWRKEGKNIFKGDFTVQDWKEVGLDTGKGAAIGAVTGAAMYTLTNYAGMAAPLATAFVSAVKGMAPLVAQYRSGAISLDELLDQGMFVCSEVGIVGLSSVIGQALIPVPLLGALVGSLVGKFLSTILSKHIKGSAEALERRTAAVYAAMDKAYDELITQIEAKFAKLGDLAKAAFDFTSNLQLTERSLAFAREVGVAEEKLIKSDAELLAFMNS